MGIVRSFGNWLKAFGYLITGRLDAARDVLETNPNVLRAKYDSIIREKVARIHEYKKAVATLVAQQEKKMNTLEELTADTERLEDLKTGAAAKARKLVETSGLSAEAIHQDPEYQKCLNAFNDFASTLEEKKARIEELEGGIAEYQESIANHKVQLQQLLRDMEGLKTESAEAVADIITAKEEKEIGDMMSGIATDGTNEELARLRDLRQRVKAESRISKELAGVDTKRQENEFLEYARKTEASTEFDALIGLAGAKESSGQEAATGETKLPE